MASVLGFDPVFWVFTSIIALWGTPVLLAGIIDSWYALIAVSGLCLLAAILVILSNPGEYLTISSEF